MTLSCPLLTLLFSVFIFYFEKSQHIFLIPLIQMLKVVEQQLLVMIQGLEFPALLWVVDVCHECTEICGRLLQQHGGRLSGKVGVDIVGYQIFHEILNGNAIKGREIVQGIDGRRYAPGLIMRIGLSRYVQMGSDKFLMISMGFPQFFQIL